MGIIAVVASGAGGWRGVGRVAVGIGDTMMIDASSLATGVGGLNAVFQLLVL